MPVGTLVASGTFALAGYRVCSGGNLLFGDSMVLPAVAPDSLVDTASSRCRLLGVSASASVEQLGVAFEHVQAPCGDVDRVVADPFQVS